MESDTVKLLRECNAGIKMGEDAIRQVLPMASDEGLRKALETVKGTHSSLGDRTHELLLRIGADTKEPHAVIRMMSSMKIKAKMMMSPTDSSIADLMTDGCDMGIKSLYRNLNKYKDAATEAKDIAKRLIASEEYLENQIRGYL